MRILHVIPSLAQRNGGAAKAVVEMCRHLSRRQHQVAIYTTNADGAYAGDADSAGHRDVPLENPVSLEGVQVTYFPVSWSNYYKISPRLAGALRREIPAYDVVHIHSLYQFPSSVAAYYSQRFNIPYILIPHGSLDPFIFRHHRPRKWVYEALFERHNLRKAAAVQFTTNEELDLASSHGLHFRGVVVPLGVDLEPTADHDGRVLRHCWPEISDRKIVLFLGRLSFKKGLDILVRAFGEVLRRRADVHLLIAGPDDEGYGHKVKRWVREAGVDGNVTFTGMLVGKVKSAALAEANLFVLPSYTENFGIAVVEAMGAGCPVVISNNVNIWREVDEAGAGLVVNIEPAEVAAAIARLLDDSLLANQMGGRGGRLAREHFSWEAAGYQLVELYQQVISASRHPSSIGRTAAQRTSI